MLTCRQPLGQKAISILHPAHPQHESQSISPTRPIATRYRWNRFFSSSFFFTDGIDFFLVWSPWLKNIFHPNSCVLSSDWTRRWGILTCARLRSEKEKSNLTKWKPAAAQTSSHSSVRLRAEKTPFSIVQVRQLTIKRDKSSHFSFLFFFLNSHLLYCYYSYL